MLLLCFATQAQQQPVVLKQGDTIPDFTVMTPKGDKISILKVAAKSTYTLIDFWASWCAPCRKEFPELKKVYDLQDKKSFNVLGIAVMDTEEKWKKALADDHAPWKHGIDNENAIKQSLKVAGVPSYLLIDSKGKLIAASLFTSSTVIQFGPAIRGAGELQATLEELLKK